MIFLATCISVFVLFTVSDTKGSRCTGSSCVRPLLSVGKVRDLFSARCPKSATVPTIGQHTEVCPQ